MEEYILIYYEVHGKEYPFRVPMDEAIDLIDDWIQQDYNLTYVQFKAMYNDNLINLNYEELAQGRYLSKLLSFYDYAIEEAYIEELRAEEQYNKFYNGGF